MGRGAQIDFNIISDNKCVVPRNARPIDKTLNMEDAIKKVNNDESINLNDQEVEKIAGIYKNNPDKVIRRCRQLAKRKSKMASKGAQHIDEKIAKILKNEAIRNNTNNPYFGKAGQRENCEVDTIWMFFAFIYIIDEFIEQK